MLNHYSIFPQKSKLQNSPFTREENLAVGKQEGENLITSARMQGRGIYIGQLRSFSGGDIFLLNHLLEMAEKNDVQVKE
jgi:hypothetical protein